MGMTLLQARERPLMLYFRVLLDDTKVGPDGKPLADWVAEYLIPKDQQPGESRAAWTARIKAMVKAQAQQELISRKAAAEVILPGEGSPL